LHVRGLDTRRPHHTFSFSSICFFHIDNRHRHPSAGKFSRLRVEPNWTRLQTFLAQVSSAASAVSTSLLLRDLVAIHTLTLTPTARPAITSAACSHLHHACLPCPTLILPHPTLEPSPPTRLAHHRNCGANTCRTLRTRRQATSTSTTREQHPHNLSPGFSTTLFPPAPSRAPTPPQP
jgi:hypothetical protein